MRWRGFLCLFQPTDVDAFSNGFPAVLALHPRKEWKGEKGGGGEGGREEIN